MFVVLSSGRSGSRAISRVFQQFPECTCYHHPTPEFIREAPEFTYDGAHKEQILGAFHRFDKSSDRDKTYGEVNLNLSLLVPLLEQAIWDLKYIWLIRDGRDTVASMFDRGWYSAEAAQSINKWHRYRLQGDRTEDYSPGEWRVLSPFQRCCWIWKKYNELIEGNLAAVPTERRITVRLNELPIQLDRLAEHVGLRPRRVFVERDHVSPKPVRYWNAWSNSQRGEFEELCGVVMDRWFPAWRDASGNWLDLVAEELDHPSPIQRFLHRAKVRALRLPGNIKRRLLSSTYESH